MAAPYRPRKVDKLQLSKFKPTDRRAAPFVATWFEQVRGQGVVFERADIVAESQAAWRRVFGPPTQAELEHAWEVQWTDRVNHALRDRCGMGFPGLGQGRWVVRQELADETALMLMAAEKAKAGHISVAAAEHRLRLLLEDRGLPTVVIDQLLAVFHAQAAA
jgi:hypothetical protein